MSDDDSSVDSTRDEGQFPPALPATTSREPPIDWRVVQRTHHYPDGTAFRWGVDATDFDLAVTVQIADWLDEATAHLIAAAPDLLLAAKEAAVVLMNVAKAGGGDPRKGSCFNRLIGAIAKAEGRS